MGPKELNTLTTNKTNFILNGTGTKGTQYFDQNNRHLKKNTLFLTAFVAKGTNSGPV